MDFGKLKEKAGEVAGTAAEKINLAMNDLNEGVPTLKALGLSVGNLRVGMGLPPEVGARLTGSAEAINADKIKKLIDSHQEKKLLILILEALRTTSTLKNQLGELGFKGVEVDVTLGLAPRVSVQLMV